MSMGWGLGGGGSSVGWGRCLGPEQKGRGSTSKGGPLERGVLEFRDRALSEGEGQGLGSVQQEGGSEGREALAMFPSVPSCPSPTISPITAGLLTIGGSFCV